MQPASSRRHINHGPAADTGSARLYDIKRNYGNAAAGRGRGPLRFHRRNRVCSAEDAPDRRQRRPLGGSEGRVCTGGGSMMDNGGGGAQNR